MADELRNPVIRYFLLSSHFINFGRVYILASLLMYKHG